MCVCVCVCVCVCGFCCCSVTKLCPALGDPIICSTPGFPVLHLLKFMSIESVMTSNHFILCCPLLLPSIFPSIRVFPKSWLFTSGGQGTGASGSASVLPMNIQGWFPLWFTGLILLCVCICVCVCVCVYKTRSSGDRKSNVKVSQVWFFLSLSPWFTEDHLLTVSSHGLLSLLYIPAISLYVQISSSYEDTNKIRLKSILVVH